MDQDELKKLQIALFKVGIAIFSQKLERSFPKGAKGRIGVNLLINS